MEDLLRSNNIKGEVSQLPHLGFYRTDYGPEIFDQRKDIGAIGGKLLNKKNRIQGGIYKKDGTALYKNLPSGYSGGLQHKAVVQQDCPAVDLRCIAIRPELAEIYEEVTGFKYLDTFHTDADLSDERAVALTEKECLALSIKVCEEIRKRGFRIMWDPGVIKKV